jgi:hypothetical protein
MYSLSKRTFMFGTACSILIGCVEEQAFEWKPETEAERALRESREKLQRTVGEGGLVGAGGGALLGAAVGGVGGAVRGAQIGRFAGAGAGLYVKQLQEQFATQEAQSKQVIRDLQATNANLEASLAAMNRVIAERKQRAAQSAIDTTRDARNADEAAATVSAATGQQDFFVATRSLIIESGIDPRSSGIDSELDRLRARVRTLRTVSEELVGI